jgi:hypothetical protein
MITEIKMSLLDYLRASLLLVWGILNALRQKVMNYFSLTNVLAFAEKRVDEDEQLAEGEPDHYMTSLQTQQSGKEEDTEIPPPQRTGEEAMVLSAVQMLDTIEIQMYERQREFDNSLASIGTDLLKLRQEGIILDGVRPASRRFRSLSEGDIPGAERD